MEFFKTLWHQLACRLPLVDVPWTNPPPFSASSPCFPWGLTEVHGLTQTGLSLRPGLSTRARSCVATGHIRGGPGSYSCSSWLTNSDSSNSLLRDKLPFVEACVMPRVTTHCLQITVLLTFQSKRTRQAECLSTAVYSKARSPGQTQGWTGVLQGSAHTTQTYTQS